MKMKFLIPCDGSPNALEAVHHGLRLLGHGLRANFVLANVQPVASVYEVVLAHDPVVLDEISEGAGQAMLKGALDLLQAAGQSVETVVMVGDPVVQLVEAVERFGCDGVLMSAHGKGRLGAAVLGSVSHGLLHRSPVPVTVVPE